MISMVSSKNKGKPAKRKYSVKKKKNRKKRTQKHEKKVSPGVQPGTSAPATNVLTTTPQ